MDYYEVISNSGILRGMHHKKYSCGRFPIVLLHGFFSSNKNGPYRLYYSLANFLEDNGFEVFRFDLSGMGESDGNITDMSFEAHLIDIHNIINSVISATKASKVHLISHCFGCCLALNGLIQDAHRIDSLIFYAPFIPSPDNFKKMIGEECYNNIPNGQQLKYKGMIFDSSFILSGYSLLNSQLLSLMPRSKFYALFAESDTFCPIRESIEWANKYAINYEIIKKADHNFLDHDVRNELYKSILSKLKLIKEEG